MNPLPFRIAMLCVSLMAVAFAAGICLPAAPRYVAIAQEAAVDGFVAVSAAATAAQGLRH